MQAHWVEKRRGVAFRTQVISRSAEGGLTFSSPAVVGAASGSAVDTRNVAARKSHNPGLPPAAPARTRVVRSHTAINRRRADIIAVYDQSRRIYASVYADDLILSNRAPDAAAGPENTAEQFGRIRTCILPGSSAFSDASGARIFSGKEKCVFT